MSQSECEIFMRNLNSVSKYQFHVKNDLNDLPSSSSFVNSQSSGGNPWAITKIQFPSSLPTTRKGYLKIQIRDNGCGVDSQELPKLFGMFEQAREHTRTVHGGTGLGLWICKQFMPKNEW